MPARKDYEAWCRITGEHTFSLLHLMIETYAFADRNLAFTFRRAMNVAIVDEIRDGLRMQVSEMLLVAQEAFATIPADRPLLQLLVDTHCTYWTVCCEDDSRAIAQLPHDFVVHAMRRLSQKLQSKPNGRKTKEKIWCYYEHADEVNYDRCQKEHMNYNRKKDVGSFGKDVLCGGACVSSDSSSPVDSEDESFDEG